MWPPPDTVARQVVQRHRQIVHVVVDAGDEPEELVFLGKPAPLHPVLEPLQEVERGPQLGQELFGLFFGEILAVHAGKVADGARLGK